MQNRKPPSCFFPNITSAANGDNDCLRNPFIIFSSSHCLSTTTSVLDIEYNGPHLGVSPSLKRNSWSMPGQCGGNRSANNILNNGRNSCYCFGISSSNGPPIKSLASMALSMSYRDALNTVSFPFLTVLKDEDPLGITIFPRNSHCGLICGSDIPSFGEYTCSRGFSVTPCTVMVASSQCVVQYCDPKVAISNANSTATSCNRDQGNPLPIG